MEPLKKPFKVYQASAGSGKTYTIVKEYLECCLGSASDIDNYRHILAITFTNLAANEMKDKIVAHLNGIINSDMNQPPQGMEKDLIDELHLERSVLKENANKLFHKILHDYSNFNVSTIDTFVQKLSRPFAKELQLPNNYGISIDKTEIAEAITNQISEQIGKASPFLTKILEDYSRLKMDNEKSPKVEQDLHEFIIELFSENAYQKNEQNQFTEQEQYDETVKFLEEKTQDFEQRYQHFLKDYETFLDRYNLSIQDFNGRSRNPSQSLWKKIQAKNFEAPTSTMMQSLDSKYKWYSDDMAKTRGSELDTIGKAYQKTYVNFLKYYKDHFGSYNFYKSQTNNLSLYVLRSVIRNAMETYIKEEQIVPLTEFNKRIHEVMGDFSVPFIYERIGEQLKYLFIDEFQDTSILQWQNLIPLIDNNLANRNKNMIVGDGKQSIYRWRNGEVGQIVSLPKIYNKPEDSPTFDVFEQTLTNSFNFNELKNNYRSFENIVTFNNTFFEFSTKAPYLDEEARKVYVDENPATGKNVSIEQHCQQQAQGLVQVELYDKADYNATTTYPARIKELIKELHQQGFQNKDITVLVRRNKQGSMVANYLKDNNIDVVSSDSIMLNSSNKVQLMIQTLTYLVHPDDPVTVASVLYYWNATHKDGFSGVIDGFFDKANAIVNGQHTLELEMGLDKGTLQSLLANSYSLYDLCSALSRAFGFNTIDDSYLNFLLDTVFNWQSSNLNSVEAFLSYWEKKSRKLAVLTGDTDAVTIMTIHKAKGLEFPVVIYPYAVDDLDDTQGSTLWIEPEKLGFEPIPHVDKVQFDITQKSEEWSAQTRAVAKEERAKIRLDNMNVNYVAFTRPVQRLYILTQKANNEGKSPLNAFVNAHQKQWVDEGDTPGASSRILYRIGDPESRKVEKTQVTASSSVVHDSRSCEWFKKISIDPNPSMFWMSKDDKMKPQRWGEFVHQVLSEVRHGQDIDRALQPYLDAGVIDPKTAAGLKGVFEQLVHHPVIGKAFLPEAKVKNECEILSKDFGVLRPDRYAELSDKIYLLDYKTGAPSDQHHRQLQRYASVLKKMVRKEIEAYLVYLSDRVEVVPVDINIS